jgi:putative transposase
MKPIHPLALFRLSVLGELVSRPLFVRGELKAILRELAQKEYAIPNSQHTRLSEKTIESWYYAYKHGGVEALAPKRRKDKGFSKIPKHLQQAIIQAKQENPNRSLNTLMDLLRLKQLEGADQLSRSSVYRLLNSKGLSHPIALPVHKELRRFEAGYPGDIVYGDVMHGPKAIINKKVKKSYLVSLMDDKSRLIWHSAFCPSETALDIEGILKQALLRRGIPKRLVIDNGAAYRSHSLQGICARLGIQLIYCKPYAPEGKGKLERWHRTLRGQFLSELAPQNLYSLPELNQLLWAWIDTLYHPKPHSALAGQTPLALWQDGLDQVSTLGTRAYQLDELFYHRIIRKVRKDSTISWLGKTYDVPYELTGKKITVVVDPHQQQALFIEDADHNNIGAVTPCDVQANRRAKRATAAVTVAPAQLQSQDGLAGLALKQQQAQLSLANTAHLTAKTREH